jgi:hypothetical protein
MASLTRFWALLCFAQGAAAEPEARKLTRSEKELASLAPWAWDPNLARHGPGRAFLRDFSEARWPPNQTPPRAKQARRSLKAQPLRLCRAHRPACNSRTSAETISTPCAARDPLRCALRRPRASGAAPGVSPQLSRRSRARGPRARFETAPADASCPHGRHQRFCGPSAPAQRLIWAPAGNGGA